MSTTAEKASLVATAMQTVNRTRVQEIATNALASQLKSGGIATMDEPEWKTEPLLMMTHGMMLFIGAAITFDRKDIDGAIDCFKAAEKQVEFFQKFMKKFDKNTQKDPVWQRYMIELDIMQGDMWLWRAILLFLTQEVSAFVKGPLLLRKSYKAYEKSFKDIKAAPDVGEGVIDACAFGFGIFNLVVGLLPSKFLKAAEIFGMRGELNTGLEELTRNQKSNDLRAPVAAFALIWFYTYTLMFFSVDPQYTVYAEAIIADALVRYDGSVFFGFSKGRVLRVKSELKQSVVAYKDVLPLVEGKKQMKQLVMYEKGWSDLMTFDYVAAAEAFSFMRDDALTTQTFYGYIAGCCLAAAGDFQGAIASFELAVQLATHKKDLPLESFAFKRCKHYLLRPPATPEDVATCSLHPTLACLENLFLWNCFINMKQEMDEPLKAAIEVATAHVLGLEPPQDKVGTALHQQHLYLIELIDASYQTLDATTCPDAQTRLMNLAKSLKGIKDKEAQHLYPHACFEYGMACQRLGESDKAVAAMADAAKPSSEYDLTQRLNTRIYGEQRWLKAQRTAPGTPPVAGSD